MASFSSPSPALSPATHRPRRNRRPWFLLLGLLVLLAAAVHTLSNRGGPYTLVGNRAEFAPQACVEYAPSGRDLHRTVFLDPGHGGPDPGAEAQAPDGKLLQEKTLTLATALAMLPILRADGYHVVLARIGDGPVARLVPGSLAGGMYSLAGEHADIQARIDCANAGGAEVLLSIHFDSYSDPSVGGVETAYDPDRPFSRQNYHFASLVQAAELNGFSRHGWNIPDRGVQTDSSLGTPSLTPQAAAYGHLLELGPAAPGWLSHPSQMPGALCEPLFLTDPGEAALAEDPAALHVLARSFVRAIAQYFQTVPQAHPPQGGR